MSYIYGKIISLYGDGYSVETIADVLRIQVPRVFRTLHHAGIL